MRSRCEPLGRGPSDVGPLLPTSECAPVSQGWGAFDPLAGLHQAYRGTRNGRPRWGARDAPRVRRQLLISQGSSDRRLERRARSPWDRAHCASAPAARLCDLVSSERTPFRCFAGNPVQSKSKFESKFQVRSSPSSPPFHPLPATPGQASGQRPVSCCPTIPISPFGPSERGSSRRGGARAARLPAQRRVCQIQYQAPPAPSLFPIRTGEAERRLVRAPRGGSRACGRAGGAGYL